MSTDPALGPGRRDPRLPPAPATCRAQQLPEPRRPHAVRSGLDPDRGQDAPSPDVRRRQWRLPSTGSSVPSLRRGLRACLDDTGLPPDQLHDLLLVACEAATNAIDHAQQPTEPFFDVSFEVEDGRVTIVVRDHGRWRDEPSGTHRGRGLALMDALADTTVIPLPHGTTVTVRPRAPDHGPDG